MVLPKDIGISSFESFVATVRVTLQNLHDPSALQTSPLVPLLVRDPVSGITGGVALRRILTDAIEAMRPSNDIPENDPEWRAYLLLKLRYLDRNNRYMVSQALAIAQASYYRLRREALTAVAAILWEQPARLQTETDTRVPLSGEERVGEVTQTILSAEQQSVDLAEILRGVIDTIRPLADLEGISLATRLVPSLVIPDIHPQALRHALIDMLLNGIEMLHTSAVEIQLDRDRFGALCRLLPQGSARPVDWAFDQERFSLCAQLVLAYGGTVEPCEVRDRTGVVLRVPLARGHTVLIVDDNDDDIRLFSLWLRAAGLSPSTARNHSELEEQLRGHSPDLILLDVYMPQWDGWAVLQSLRAHEETQKTPIVICSVLNRPKLALALGADRVLTKPVTEYGLMEVLQELLSLRGS